MLDTQNQDVEYTFRFLQRLERIAITLDQTT